MTEAPVFEWSDVFGARAELESFRVAIANQVEAHRSDSLPDSPHANDLSGFSRPESVSTIFGQVMLLMEVAADQLTAFLKTTAPPFESIAPWTCVRTLLESSARACWLLEPDLDVKDRVARSIALRYEGLVEQRKYLISLGESPDSTSERMDEVSDLAISLGIRVQQNRKGRRIALGPGVPSATDLVKTQLGEESMYRLLSAMTHGHSWAIHQLAFEVVDHPWPSRDGGRLLTKAVFPNAFMYLALGCARSFALVTWYHVLYLGWNQQTAVSSLVKLYDGLNVRDDLRFWSTDGVK